MLRELEKGRLWNLCALRPLRWFQGWLGITNYPEEHFKDELQHPVNNPVWRGQRQETVKSLCLLSFLCVKIKDVLLKAFCLHLKYSSSFYALQKYTWWFFMYSIFFLETFLCSLLHKQPDPPGHFCMLFTFSKSKSCISCPFSGRELSEAHPSHIACWLQREIQMVLSKWGACYIFCEDIFSLDVYWTCWDVLYPAVNQPC